MASRTDTADAVTWLAGNRNKNPFASNMMSRAYAMSLFEKLLQDGAKKLLVTEILDDSRTIEEEGGPYSATLLIEANLGNPSVFMEIISTLVTAKADEVSVMPKLVGKCNVLRAWWD